MDGYSSVIFSLVLAVIVSVATLLLSSLLFGYKNAIKWQRSRFSVSESVILSRT